MHTPKIIGYYSYHTSFWKMDFCLTFSLKCLFPCQLLFAKDSVKTVNLPAGEKRETTPERSITQTEERHQEYGDFLPENGRPGGSALGCLFRSLALYFTSSISQMNSPAQESILNSMLALHSETNLASFTCFKQAPAT